MKNAITVFEALIAKFRCKHCMGVGQITDVVLHDTLCPKCDGAGIIYPTPTQEGALDIIFSSAMNTKVNVEDNTIEEVETAVQDVVDAIERM